MLKTDWRESKITTEHLAKLTYVYVRQSSLNQVMHNRESTELQYQLVDRENQPPQRTNAWGSRPCWQRSAWAG
jgi:hypothetical protein